jgi:hypothetical protein
MQSSSGPLEPGQSSKDGSKIQAVVGTPGVDRRGSSIDLSPKGSGAWLQAKSKTLWAVAALASMLGVLLGTQLSGSQTYGRDMGPMPDLGVTVDAFASRMTVAGALAGNGFIVLYGAIQNESESCAPSAEDLAWYMSDENTNQFVPSLACQSWSSIVGIGAPPLTYSMLSLSFDGDTQLIDYLYIGGDVRFDASRDHFLASMVSIVYATSSVSLDEARAFIYEQLLPASRAAADSASGNNACLDLDGVGYDFYLSSTGAVDFTLRPLGCRTS